MHRRNFLKAGSLAGLTLSAFGASALDKPSGQFTPQPARVGTDAFELNEITVEQLQQKMKSGALTSQKITSMYLDRIQAIDKNGPKLNAIIELNPDALSIAEAMDKERSTGKVRGPLHGIPVLVKDNISTGDKMHTTAGALALADNVMATDAFIIKKLRAAGAVLLGKTNLSEWADFRSTRSASAWSSRAGQTKCPYILDRNPSGSSAGSAVATTANLCAVAIGTESDGSIVSPCSVNGLVGIKPTVGLCSRVGIIPISKTQDTPGPLTRTVKDAALLLDVLAGRDPEDSYTDASNGYIPASYTKFLDANSLRGKRLGVEKEGLKVNPQIDAIFSEAIALLKKKGATIVEVEVYKKMEPSNGLEFMVFLYEFKDGLNKYLAGANSKVKSLADVIAFNNANAAQTMPFFKQDILEQALAKGDLTTVEYLEAVNRATSVSRDAIDSVLKDNKLDAIIAPTNGFACCIDLVNGDYDNGFAFAAPAAIAGYPHITVPMGSFNDLPVGLSFVSTAFKESEIIKLAYAYEQASLKRVPPGFRGDLLA